VYKTKDFILMDVFKPQGEKLGYINDLYLDINESKVCGFEIKSTNLFKKNFSIKTEKIIFFNDYMLVEDSEDISKMKFSTIKGMDVINMKKDIIGIVEDLIFCKDNFMIIGIVINSGFLADWTNGKKIILLKDLLIGEKNILCSSSSNMNLKAVFHKPF